MKWIESNGGPLILVPSNQLRIWRGANDGPSENETDYDRACEVADYVGVLQVGEADALVLGDEPLRTAWVPTENGGVIVRWVYADSEESVIHYVAQNNLGHLLEDTGISIHLSGSCVLFDAAEPGDDIRGRTIEIDINERTYVVKSALVDASPDVRLLIHQLSPTGMPHDSKATDPRQQQLSPPPHRAPRS